MANLRNIKKLDQEQINIRVPSQKITRDAFLYMDPISKNPNKEEFAQCGTCMMYVGDYESGQKKAKCSIMGKNVIVDGEYGSCGLFVPGPNHPNSKGQEEAYTTPEIAGYIENKPGVRCENCVYFDARSGFCDLFYRLNENLSEYFNLDPKVKAKACCNAFIPS